jgi:hypothetical protein
VVVGEEGTSMIDSSDLCNIVSIVLEAGGIGGYMPYIVPLRILVHLIQVLCCASSSRYLYSAKGMG